jgi:hypothetical protein
MRDGTRRAIARACVVAIAVALGGTIALVRERGAVAGPDGPSGADGGAAIEGDAGGDAPACGKPGLPPCPMQAFMRSSVSAPLASRDDAALASALERTARLVPDPAWASWIESAKTGAAAARQGDVAGARASCKACHDAWRDAYRARFRARSLTP